MEMKMYKLQIVIEVEKKFEENNEAHMAANEMSDDIHSYLESMKHAVDDLWRDCSSITVKECS